MKINSKKSRAGVKAAKPRPKKKKLKKMTAADKLKAAALAGVIILAAMAASMTGIYLYSTRAGGEPVAAAQPVTEAPARPDNDPPSQSAAVTPAAQAPAAHTPVVAAQPVAHTPAQTPVAAAQPPAQTPAAQAPAVNTALPAGGISGTAPTVVAASAAAAHRGTVAIVIDDAGNNLRELEPFLRFPGPITIAVLPGLPNSAEAARRVRAAGKEVFLHQPMESIGGTNPGPGAIRAGMGRDEIRAIVSRNLDEIWPVAGMNNHEGSRVTMDEEAMKAILELCRERGILFLDSRTTADTAAPVAARKLGMTIGERDVFIDNTQDRESMAGYIKTGLARAEQRGAAIMIGHTWSPDLAPLLSELYPDLVSMGYVFSSASELINGKQ